MSRSARPALGPASLAELGYLRAAVVVPALVLGDPAANAIIMTAALEQAGAQGARLALFPELALTGYTCADLFYSEILRQAALKGLADLAAASARLGIGAVVGLPLEVSGHLYNVAAVIADGAVVGFVPKIFLPTSGEFYESRWFSSGRVAGATSVDFEGRAVPFGTDLLFAVRDAPGAVLGVEICEDLWAPVPPSGELALAGATVLLNLSASNDILGKVAYRRALVGGQSARCLAAYLYASSGPGESSTDLVFGGDALIAENGTFLAQTSRFHFDTQMALADLDMERLRNERLHSSSFASSTARPTRTIEIGLPFSTLAADRTVRDWSLLRPLSPTPFIPEDKTAREANCAEIFSLCATGLARRLRHTGSVHVTLGLSGGLDSTLALLVAVRAFDSLGLSRKGIEALSLPGPGTSARTKRNAVQLAASLGVSFLEIPIGPAVARHFVDIRHDPAAHDLTFQNAQARERTQILMDRASQIGGFMVGTGDLSEIALGWCTYNGDQMSMYNVNAGVPKTLVKYLVEWAAEAEVSGPASDLLRDILATPISPELLPSRDRGALSTTESVIGPYRLHDFFLYYAIRFGFSPHRVRFLAQSAFAGEYDEATIDATLEIFYRRFFAAQFKRSALPDGPKVGTVALSPRGDWRMPSDVTTALWLRELAALGRSTDSTLTQDPVIPTVEPKKQINLKQ